MKYCFFAALLAIAAISCNYSSHPIDEKPAIRLDSRLTGIWKAVEDTSKANFILVQSYRDTYWDSAEIMREFGSLKNYIAKVNQSLNDRPYADTLLPPMAPPRNTYDLSLYADTLQLIRELKYRNRDTLKLNFFHYLTYFNRQGRNPFFQQWGSYLSKVNNSLFLNIPYRYTPTDANGNSLRTGDESGYLLARLIKVSAETVITALVADPSLKTAKSSAEVRNRVTKNLNNKNYYSDTVHFYKVKGGHFGLNESMKLANQ